MSPRAARSLSSVLRGTNDTQNTRNKRGGETVDGMLNRAFDALEVDESTQNGSVPRCTDCQCQAEVWTVEDGQLVCGASADSNIELSSSSASTTVGE